MIATEEVDDDLWFLVLPEFVEDGLDDTFFQNGIRWVRLWFLQLLRRGRRGFLLFAEASVDAEARESKSRPKGLHGCRPDILPCL